MEEAKAIVAAAAPAQPLAPFPAKIPQRNGNSRLKRLCAMKGLGDEGEVTPAPNAMCPYISPPQGTVIRNIT